MGRRLPNTPRSRVRSALRQLWLRSRERAAALKATGYTCARCGAKQSKAKGKELSLEVHHRDGIDVWEAIMQLIYERLLCDPAKLEPLCADCHAAQHKKEATQL